jgi:hypothetical protein
MSREQDRRRAALESRWREIAEQLAAINQGKTMPENPAELEDWLLEEQEEIEALLSEDYLGPPDDAAE